MSAQALNGTSYNGYKGSSSASNPSGAVPTRDASDVTRQIKEQLLYLNSKDTTTIRKDKSSLAVGGRPQINPAGVNHLPGNSEWAWLPYSNQYRLSYFFGKMKCITNCSDGLINGLFNGNGPVLPGSMNTTPEVNPISNSDPLPSAIRSRLSLITFFVWRSTGSSFTYTGGILKDGDNVVTNANVGTDIRGGGATSISDFSSVVTTTRNSVIADLNQTLGSISGPKRDLRFSLASPAPAGSYRLVASLTDDGKLILSIASSGDGGAAGAPYTTGLAANERVGIFFGNANNGSTALGATSTPPTGVSGSALIIGPGQTSITAPFRVGGQ